MIQNIKKYSTTNTLVVVGIILGVLFGSFLPELALKQQVIGQMFISFLKMLVVPLVFSSIYVAILGLGGIDKLKDIGLKTLGLYFLTTALAVLLAIVVMNIVNIGEVTSAEGLEFAKASKVVEATFSSMVLSFIPTNVFSSLANGSMMQIIVFALFFGVASLHLKEAQQDLMLSFFSTIMDIMLTIAEWIIKLTPIGVFSLISYVIADQGIDVIVDLWRYIAVVLAVLFLHVVITLPMVLSFFGKTNPYRYINQIREVPIMAFSTASSAATLPVSMRIAEEVGGVDESNASFVLPLGATVSMDGTAAYLTIAVLYIANLAGLDLSLME